MDVVNLFLTIIYMFEIFALFLVIIILCFTLLPAVWSTIQKSSAFLKNNLITLAILFTFLTIVSDVHNWALGVYHRQTYLTAYRWITGGHYSPVARTIQYADANKSWVMAMIFVFVGMAWHFARQQRS